MEYLLMAALLAGGGILWCRLWPDERDRFRHTCWMWAAILAIALLLNVDRFGPRLLDHL